MCAIPDSDYIRRECLRCGSGFWGVSGEDFRTCPGCRIPLRSEDIKTIRIRRTRFRARHVDGMDSDPGFENLVRAMEGG